MLFNRIASLVEEPEFFPFLTFCLNNAPHGPMRNALEELGNAITQVVIHKC